VDQTSGFLSVERACVFTRSIYVRPVVLLIYSNACYKHLALLLSLLTRPHLCLAEFGQLVDSGQEIIIQYCRVSTEGLDLHKSAGRPQKCGFAHYAYIKVRKAEHTSRLNLTCLFLHD
jgi:hypothetical protein